MTMTVSSFTATVRGFQFQTDRRGAAGWDFDPEYGWGSPEGITETDWELEHGYPLPEDEDFATWFRNLHGQDSDPFPKASTAQRQHWGI